MENFEKNEETGKKRSYPCDEPQDRRRYPCDEPQDRRRYPCDEPQDRRSYPCDEPQDRRSYPCDEPGYRRTEEEQPEKKRINLGGRRGGNAAASKVIHSGKITERSGNRRNGTDRRSANEGHRDAEGRRGGADRKGYGERTGRKEYGERTDRKRFGEKNSFRKENGSSRSFFEPDQDEGRTLTLRVLENSEIGAFLDYEGASILLPFSEQLRKVQRGEEVRVFLYKDKGDRLTATMRTPILETGSVGILKAADVTKIGVFLDNGTPKQVLLPFREQITQPEEGSDVLVYLYRDKSGRTAATMRVYKYLDSHAPYREGDTVTGFVYEINPTLGIFLAVDNRYFGMIPISEAYTKFRYGDIVSARVVRVRDDGKLDLSTREKSYLSIDSDAEKILEMIRAQGGELPYADRVDAALIEKEYQMSKNQWKRAVGHLFKQRKIMIDRENGRISLL